MKYLYTYITLLTLLLLLYIYTSNFIYKGVLTVNCVNYYK